MASKGECIYISDGTCSLKDDCEFTECSYPHTDVSDVLMRAIGATFKRRAKEDKDKNKAKDKGGEE